MTNVHVTTDTDALKEALKTAMGSMRHEARGWVNDSLLAVERQTKVNLALKSHKRGTPTPSLPGEPPALISGALRRSVKISGRGGRKGVYTGSVGPTMIYSRIQELGGVAGRNHRASLPARPYLKPAVLKSLPAMGKNAVGRVRAAWAIATGGAK